MKTMSEVNDELLENAEMIDAKITFGIIIRDNPRTVRDLQRYLQHKKINIVFKKYSLDNLYVIYSGDYQQLQKLKNQE